MFSMRKNRTKQNVQQAESAKIKENMTSGLIEVVKEIQHKYRNQEKAIESNDETSRLCAVLEAIFIHGLKETFLGRLSSRLALADVSPKMPEPSFWTFVLVFSHKEVISTIEKLSQVGSEVGRSRAWIRAALNDGLLVPYLTSMAEDMVSLSVHYNTHAFLRDPERMDVAMRYLSGIEVYNFKLAVNASILNRWQPGPLVMAGAWAAPVVQESVDEAAVDIASTLETQTSPPPSSFSRTLAQPIAANNSYIQRGLLNEDEALRLILASTPVLFGDSPVTTSTTIKERREEVNTPTIKERREEVTTPTIKERREEVTTSTTIKERREEVTTPTIKERRDLVTTSTTIKERREEVTTPTIKERREEVTTPAIKERKEEALPQNKHEVKETVTNKTISNENKDEVMEEKDCVIYTKVDERKSKDAFPTEPDGPIEDISHNLPETPCEDEQLSSPVKDPAQAMSFIPSTFQPISPPSSPRSMSPLSPQRTPSPEWDLEPTTSVNAHNDNIHDVSCSSLGDEIAVADPENWCKRTPEPAYSPSPEPLRDGSRSPSPEARGMSPSRNSITERGMSPRRSSITDSCRSSCSSPDQRISADAMSSMKISLSPDCVSAVPDLITQQAERAKRKSVAKVGFQQPPSVMVQQLTLQQNMALLSCLDIVCREQGLDSQDWQCADCTRAIGTIFGSGRVCEYTKKYYCEECHNNADTAVIPARLLYNWDCSQYKVARSSLFYLSQVSVKPLIDVRTFNPSLSRYAPALDLIQQQRQRLIYLDAYLSACGRASGEAVKIALAEAVWPREYLYTHTDLYSVRDLEQVHSGEMITVLNKALKVCLDHVNKCLVCRGRGFICELCRDRKPVYPFDLETTSQCPACFTVFHSSCSRGLSQCPRCERLEARSLNWHVNNVRLTRTGL